jgi:hypothetical protein
MAAVVSRGAVLRAATKDDLGVMMGWFPDCRSCRIWGGRNIWVQLRWVSTTPLASR